MVPAVGYGARLRAAVPRGITTPLIVSPAKRLAVNAPIEEVPVVFSVPADAPWILSCVFPFAGRSRSHCSTR